MAITPLFHSREAAAAGAHLDEVDSGNAGREPAAFLQMRHIHFELAGQQRRATLDQTQLGRRSPHVDRLVAKTARSGEERAIFSTPNHREGTSLMRVNTLIAPNLALLSV
jgi:hypothetical protein